MSKGFLHKFITRFVLGRQRASLVSSGGSRLLYAVFAKLQPAAAFAAVCASVVCLVLLVLYFGYERSINDAIRLRTALRSVQLVFAFNIILRLIVNPVNAVRSAKALKWIVDSTVLLSVLAAAMSRLHYPLIQPAVTVLCGNVFLSASLAAYSVLEVCHAAMLLIGRRTNPVLILSGSFLIFILIGSFLLMMPKCTTTPISYFDSLFTATSAVCITGLCPIDIPSVLTPLGLLVLAILVQIGGLGVMTFTSFFAIFFSGSPSIYSQLMVKDMIYSKTINNLIPTLLYILAFTMTVEALGALAVYFTIPDSLGMDNGDKIVFAAFHSLSSFCNAGFSCLPGGMSNAALLNSSQSIYLVTSLLIFAGAIGFPILVNFKDIFTRWFHRLITGLRHRTPTRRVIHVYDLNTKLVLVTTLAVLVAGSAGFLIFEYDNTLAGMSVGHKIIQSVFNALTPRSAGFASVNPSLFLPVTVLLVVVQMWIGGSSQSLAGGIKVNTFAVIVLNLTAIVRGRDYATAFSRRISVGSVRRANAVLAISVAAFVGYAVVELLLEPALGTKELLFEVTSAFFTVGSSLGITDQLSPASKIVLSTAMFAGRVGLLSLLVGFASDTRDRSAHYPPENVIIS